MRVVTIKFPVRLLQELDAYALKHGLERSEVIRKAVKEYIRGGHVSKKVIRVKYISLINGHPSDGDFRRHDICVERLGKSCWALSREEKRELIKQLLREGWSQHRIARALDVAGNTVWELKKEVEVVQK